MSVKEFLDELEEHEIHILKSRQERVSELVKQRETIIHQLTDLSKEDIDPLIQKLNEEIIEIEDKIKRFLEVKWFRYLLKKITESNLKA